MSNEWDINNIRKIAGLPLMEAFRGDDEDDEDPDAKIASTDKRQAAFEKKNKNEMRRAELEATNKEKVDAKKAAEAKAEKKAAPAEKKEEPKAEPKAEEKAEDKKEEPKSSTRGRKPSDSSKMGQARSWITSHPEASRGDFLKHAESFGMSKAYGSAFFYSVRKKTKVEECYVLTHPQMPSFMLAENRELNQMQWVDPTSPLEPMIFESEAEAEKVAKYMSEWKSQFVNILAVKLVD